MSDKIEIRHSEAFAAYTQVMDHVNSVGMVSENTDKALQLLESYLRQQATK